MKYKIVYDSAQRRYFVADPEDLGTKILALQARGYTIVRVEQSWLRSEAHPGTSTGLSAF